MRQLSEEWFQAARDAVGALVVPAELRVAVGQVVTGGPDGDIEYQLVCEDGRCLLSRGVDDASVVLTETYQTALDISAGRRSAGHALLDGDITMRGDGTHLIAATAVLGLLGAAMRTGADEGDA